MKIWLNRILSIGILFGAFVALVLLIPPALPGSITRGATADTGDLLKIVEVPKAAQ